MLIDKHLISVGHMASTAGERQLRVVDLAACSTDAVMEAVPLFPLIGIGDATHPLAVRMDVLVESPVSLSSITGMISRTPLAAAALVQLLRAIDGMKPGRALTLESLCYAMLQGSSEHATWLAARKPEVGGAAGAVIVARENDVLHVTIDRPWARNAIDLVVRDQLNEAFAIAAHDASVTEIRLRATGPTFGVGADLAEFGTTRDPVTAHLIRAQTLPANMLARRPGILNVHVQGACIGASLELAACAGQFTATPDAWFQLPELTMGIIPGAGGCVSVPRRIGRQRAGLMMLSGRRINAATALRWGLIDAIVDTPPGYEGGADGF